MNTTITSTLITLVTFGWKPLFEFNIIRAVEEEMVAPASFPHNVMFDSSSNFSVESKELKLQNCYETQPPLSPLFSSEKLSFKLSV